MPVTPSSPRARRSAPTWAVIGILSLCGTVVALQQTMVIPLLPDFPGILGVSADDAAWLVTATLLTSAVATPIMSRLADMFGKRLMMLACMVAMTVGCVLAAAVGTYLAVIVGRSLQGFAAALIPIGISIMRDELPKEKVGSAVALMSATLGIGAALGLPLSGLIFENLGWQAIFWISAGIGAALIIGVLSLVSESTVRTRGRFDYLGALLLSVALTALLLGISKGGSWGWGSQRVVGLFLVTAAVLAVWVPYELKIGHPLVDLRTSARRPVLLTNIASILAGFAMFANLLLTTQQLQLPESTGYGFGLPVITAGTGHGSVRSGHGAVRAGVRSDDQPLRRPHHPDDRGGHHGRRVHRPGLLLVHRARRDHRFDRGRDRHRHRLRGHAHPDHGIGADHRDRQRERTQCPAARGRYVLLECRGRGRAGVGDHAGRAR